MRLTSRTQPQLLADAECLRQALENIIRNAVKYTTDSTQVDVSLLDNGNDTCTVSVCDSGPGVDDEMLDQLFEPFVRVSEAREQDHSRPQVGGYGLGLAIAKRAIEMHDGTVTARNRPSGGLCIDIVLPTNCGDINN